MKEIQNNYKVRKVCLFTTCHYDWSGHRKDRNVYCTISTGIPCSYQVELAWLTRYPLPNKVIVDRGNVFLAEFREMITNDYGITVKPITSRNPQANAILERVHQTIGNILRTFKVQNMVLDDKNPWNSILTSTMFALRATVHTTTQYTSA